MSQSMKLVDILAREMKVWPDQYYQIYQDTGGNLHGTLSDGDAEDCCQEDLPYGPVAIAWDGISAFVTREQWQAAVDALKAPVWNGEGLPPVGVDALLKFELKMTEGSHLESFPAGTAVYVGGHANFGGCDLAVIIIKGRHYCGTVIPSLLEPVRTAEQIEAEQKSTAVQRMVADFGLIIVGPREFKLCERLYDAGYRKQAEQ